MEIKRYECWKTESGTTFDVADPVGKFVLYDDHKAKVESLEARIKEQEDAIDCLRKVKAWDIDGYIERGFSLPQDIRARMQTILDAAD